MLLEEVPAEHSVDAAGDLDGQHDELQGSEVLARSGKHFRLIERWAVRPANRRRESGIHAHNDMEPWGPDDHVDAKAFVKEIIAEIIALLEEAFGPGDGEGLRAHVEPPPRRRPQGATGARGARPQRAARRPPPRDPRPRRAGPPPPQDPRGREPGHQPLRPPPVGVVPGRAVLHRPAGRDRRQDLRARASAPSTARTTCTGCAATAWTRSPSAAAAPRCRPRSASRSSTATPACRRRWPPRRSCGSSSASSSRAARAATGSLGARATPSSPPSSGVARERGVEVRVLPQGRGDRLRPRHRPHRARRGAGAGHDGRRCALRAAGDPPRRHPRLAGQPDLRPAGAGRRAGGRRTSTSSPGGRPGRVSATRRSGPTSTSTA